MSSSSSSSTFLTSGTASGGHQPQAGTLPLPPKKRLLIINTEEIDQLEKECSAPIPAHPKLHGENIKDLRITRRVLNHIFGLEILHKINQKEHRELYVSGYHHTDYSQMYNEDGHVNEDNPVCYIFSQRSCQKYVSEGFISYRIGTTRGVPKFKTFFKCNVSRQQVIQAVLESLQNIESVQPDSSNSDRLVVIGTSAIIGGCRIKSVICKCSGEFITFFPEPGSGIARDQIKDEEKALERQFCKHFYNIKGLPPRPPLSEDEISHLLSLYPNGIASQWYWIHADENTIPFYKWGLEQLKQFLPPSMKYSLVNDSILSSLRSSVSLRRLNIIRVIPTISFTAETLQRTFGKKVLDDGQYPGDQGFPIYLTREYILSKLKDALNEFLSGYVQNTFVMEPSSERNSPTPVSQTHYDNLQHSAAWSNSLEKTGAVMTCGSISIRCTHPLPHTPIHHEPTSGTDLIWLRCTSTGVDYEDTWTFLVRLDPVTGIIFNFFVLSDTPDRSVH